MTDTPQAVQQGPARRVKIDSPASALAAVPQLLGFHPERSLVVLGITGSGTPGTPGSQVKLTFRYDLPDPPDPDAAAGLVAHARQVLARERVKVAIMAGYGPGPMVTPVADAIVPAFRAAGIKVQDMLRVEDGRYWSYLCREPRCCPPEGVAFDAERHPLARALAGKGAGVLPDRASLAATLDPDPERAPLVEAAVELLGRIGTPLLRKALRAGRRNEVFLELAGEGREAVRAALASYREGGGLSEPLDIAQLGLMLRHIAVRDDAWARMDPGHYRAHRRLWTDLVRQLPEGLVAAPASLLAFVCWQAGDGALASIAVERALQDDPEYSMAHLIGDALGAGLPPAAARLPMTPEEVEESYASQMRQRPAKPAARRRGRGQRPAEPARGPGGS